MTEATTDMQVTKQKTSAKRRKKARGAGSPAAPKPTNEFAGITATTCCAGCTPDRCVISTVAVCKHPYKSSDAGCGPVTMRNRLAAKKLLKKQKVDAA